MKKLFVQVGAAALIAAFAVGPAQALTFVSQLEYKDTGGSGPAKGASYGTVTAEDQADGKSVKITVQLADGARFLNTGGPHEPFVYNLTDNLSVNLSAQSALDGFKAGVTPFDADAGGYDPTPGSGAYNFQSTPFGYFTNKIGCCLKVTEHPEIVVPPVDVPPEYFTSGPKKGQIKKAGYTIPGYTIPAGATEYDEKNGAANAATSQLVFTVSSADAFSFAGINPNIDLNTGILVGPGSGNHFKSNTSGAQGGGWWFAADIVTTSGATFNVAARDAITNVTPSVPEASTWAMMLVGFGGVGLSIRSRRRRQTPVVAA